MAKAPKAEHGVTIEVEAIGHLIKVTMKGMTDNVSISFRLNVIEAAKLVREIEREVKKLP
jgi:hypothetical protein